MDTRIQQDVLMPNFLALGDNGYLHAFAKGSDGECITDFNYESDITKPIAFRGISKRDLIYRCWQDKRDFYFMDTGYFGNYASKYNPKGQKHWHRIVKNNVQHVGNLINRPDDRWKKLQEYFPTLTWTGWKKSGKNILLVAPSAKPCKFYGIKVETWINDTVEQLRKYTDREIIIRHKTATRNERSTTNTIYDAMNSDVFAVVTYNSIAASEAVAYGIPAFTLAPNAAHIVSCNDLSLIETPYYPDPELVYRWCCHLSYGQFNSEDMISGLAWRIINDC
jgi:hypothetical protein